VVQSVGLTGETICSVIGKVGLVATWVADFGSTAGEVVRKLHEVRENPLGMTFKGDCTRQKCTTGVVLRTAMSMPAGVGGLCSDLRAPNHPSPPIEARICPGCPHWVTSKSQCSCHRINSTSRSRCWTGEGFCGTALLIISFVQDFPRSFVDYVLWATSIHAFFR